MSGARAVIARIAAAARASAWAPLVGRALLAAAAFVLLALVGSGAIGGRWLRGGDAFAGAPRPAGDAGAGVDAGAPVDAGAAPVDAGPVDAGDAGPGDAGAPVAVTADGRVVLNVAGEEELRRLPGIGKVRARSILELRARLGKFRRPEELLRVRGLGRRSFARLRPLVVCDPP